MARIVLPRDLPIHSDQPVCLVGRQGTLVLAQAPTFPKFYAQGQDLAAALGGDPAKPGQARLGGHRMPILPTDEGVVFDTEWTVFGHLGKDLTDGRGDAAMAIFHGCVRWDVQCPAMEHHASLMGQLMALYGARTGGSLDAPGMNDSDFMRAHPLVGLLAQAGDGELADFRDRGQTLLDMALLYQQWHLAGVLWDRGVRWSQQALDTGKPLEALVVATLGLQGPAVMRANDAIGAASGPERVAWLLGWLDRYAGQGGAVAPEPALDWRARRARARGWEDGASVVDSPASFWVSRFLTPAPGSSGLASPGSKGGHVTDLVRAWARFWVQGGVDLETIRVGQGRRLPEAVGFAGFWSQARNAQAWVDIVGEAVLEGRLDRRLPAAKPRAGTRL